MPNVPIPDAVAAKLDEIQLREGRFATRQIFEDACNKALTTVGQPLGRVVEEWFVVLRHRHTQKVHGYVGPMEKSRTKAVIRSWQLAGYLATPTTRPEGKSLTNAI